jgi:galactonate dehydratase
MALVQSQIPIPVATGERIHTIFEFSELLEKRAMRYARISVCVAGGLTHSKKIAAIAEAYHVGVVPHNPRSDVSTAACLQLDASIPNFALQELPYNQALESGQADEVGSQVLKEPLQIKEGYLIVPDRPGIGVDLLDDVAERFPYVPKEVRTRLHADGSVVDQ